MIYELSEEELKIVSLSIKEIVEIYSKNKQIEGIYMTNFLQKENLKELPIIKMVTIYSGNLELKISEKEREKIDFLIKNVRDKTNVNISLYNSESTNFSEKINGYKKLGYALNLYNGYILFDKNGKYIELKNRFNKMINSDDIYKNVIEFKPSLCLKFNK